MNRIILIGNGFDLAHGLETSYKHFIDDYWGNVAKSLKEKGGYSDDHVEIIPNGNNYHFYALSGTIGYFSELKDTTYKGIKDFLQSLKCAFKVKNIFLDKISDECSFKNWVDIEKEYYLELIKCINNSSEINIETLNIGFDGVKQLLSNHLSTIKAQKHSYKSDVFARMVSEFRYRDFTQTFKKQYVSEKIEQLLSDFDKNIDSSQTKNFKFKNAFNDREQINQKKIEKYLNTFESATVFPDLLTDNVLFVNFNYTSTLDIYKDEIYDYNKSHQRLYNQQPFINLNEIFIHGKLNNSNNRIIFGFGDEIDEDYSRIENLDDNRYLENIKSTKYHETDNYKKLLEYIDSDYFQIFIFGHSCGLSDRTLLSTLFNHDNCISIKPFYYIKEDGSDNYSDLVRNISRHFKDKASLRDKVVNKTYCEPLTGSK